jgi:hypothetical protein
MLRTALFAAGFLCAVGATATAQAAPDSLALARQYTQWLYAGMADSLVAHMSADAATEPDPRAAWMQRSQMIADRAGLEMQVVEETWKKRNGRWQYWRTARFSGMDEPVLVRWVLNAKGEIDGIGLGPLSQAPPTDQ